MWLWNEHFIPQTTSLTIFASLWIPTVESIVNLPGKTRSFRLTISDLSSDFFIPALYLLRLSTLLQSNNGIIGTSPAGTSTPQFGRNPKNPDSSRSWWITSLSTCNDCESSNWTSLFQTTIVFTFLVSLLTHKRRIRLGYF